MLLVCPASGHPSFGPPGSSKSVLFGVRGLRLLRRVKALSFLWGWLAALEPAVRFMDLACTGVHQPLVRAPRTIYLLGTQRYDTTSFENDIFPFTLFPWYHVWYGRRAQAYCVGGALSRCHPSVRMWVEINNHERITCQCRCIDRIVVKTVFTRFNLAWFGSCCFEEALRSFLRRAFAAHGSNIYGQQFKLFNTLAFLLFYIVSLCGLLETDRFLHSAAAEQIWRPSQSEYAKLLSLKFRIQNLSMFLATMEATSKAWRLVIFDDGLQTRLPVSGHHALCSYANTCKPPPRHLQWKCCRVLQDLDRSRSPDRRLHRKAGWPSLLFSKFY